MRDNIKANEKTDSLHGTGCLQNARWLQVYRFSFLDFSFNIQSFRFKICGLKNA